MEKIIDELPIFLCSIGNNSVECSTKITLLIINLIHKEIANIGIETSLLQQLETAVTAKDRSNGKKHEVWKESFDWKYCETARFAYQKLIYMHNNPCAGKWKLVEDITKYQHSSARYYITGKHAAYEVVDVEEIIRENTLKKEASVLRSSPESLPTAQGLE